MPSFLWIPALFVGVALGTVMPTPTLESRDFLLDPSLLLPGRSTCNILSGVNPWTPLSCANTTAQADLCCFNSPGGQFLLTQFWDYQSKAQYAGPNDTWTLHGLWPDHCDGTFDQYCAPDREVTNITQILQFHGEAKLLDWMHTYWKDNTGNDETFWEHEFNKHGTCISTLEPQCIRNFKDRNDVVIYIKRAISIFQLLPTHAFLARKGIKPSTTTMYNLTDVVAALKSATGKTPTIQCNGKGSVYLHELWYHFETKGSVIDGVFLPADPDGSKGSCAEKVYYWPKGVPTPTPAPTTTTTTSSAPTPTSTEDKGTLQVYTADGKNVGCVLSKGTWSQQTCASFRPLPGVAPGSITFNHSKGPCAVDFANGTLSCGATITVGSDFTNSTIATGSLVAFGGSTGFSADVLPTGQVQSTIWADGEHPQAITIVYVRS